MAKTYLTFNGVVGTNNPKEVFKQVEKFVSLAKEAGLSGFTFSTHGTEEDFENGTTGIPSSGAVAGGTGSGGRGGRGGRVGRSEAGERAAADFAEGADEAEGDGSGTGTDDGDARAEPAAPRKRGRPPGSGKRAADGGNAGEAGSGSAAGKRDDGKRAEGAGRAAEGTRGNEPVGTRQGARQGAGEGQGRSGGAGGGGDDQRGNREAPRISTGDDRGEADSADAWDDNEDAGGETDSDWDDAAPASTYPPEHAAAMAGGPTYWPDNLMPKVPLTKEVFGELLADHFNATGGKDREPTFAIMQEITGERSIKSVKPEDYDKLARALLKDTAKYRYGIKTAK